LAPPAEAKLTSRPSSMDHILIWKPYLSSALKAMRELSGEMRGEMAIVPRWVMACWLAPS
jgi:hypothetical protein